MNSQIVCRYHVRCSARGRIVIKLMSEFYLVKDELGFVVFFVKSALIIPFGQRYWCDNVVQEIG